MRRLFLPSTGMRSFCNLFSDSEDPIPIEKIDEEVELPTEPGEKTIRILPIPKHPIFAKHMVKFRLGSGTFKFLLAKDDTKHMAAFVMKKREGSDKDLEVYNLQTITPFTGIDSIYDIGAYCETVINKFERTVVLKPISKIKLDEVTEEVTNDVPFPLAKVTDMPEQTAETEEEKKQDNSLIEILMNEIDDVRDLLTHQELTTLDLFAQNYDMRNHVDFINYVGVILSYMCDTHRIQEIFQPTQLSTRIRLTTELAQEHVQMRMQMKDLQNEAQSKISKQNEEVIPIVYIFMKVKTI